MPLRRSIFGFFFPAALILGVAATVLRSDAAPMLRSLHGFSVLVYAGAALVAWRFHSTRMLFSIVALAIAEAGMRFASGDPASFAAARDLAAILLPANLVAFTFIPERGFFSRTAAAMAGVVIAQAGVAGLLCRPEWQAANALEWTFLPTEPMSWLAMPQIAFLLYVSGLLFLLTRYVLVRSPLESGSFWAVVACGAAFSTNATGVYIMVAGMVLGISVIENSYLMAYHDQLTGLPARRAFHQLTASIPGHYTIAVVDVDHFKAFNDTFGHDIGDQVLRMVAARMARVTGGGKAFRWGGEEFVIVFFGKTAADALEHLELMRQLVEASSFIVRGRDRWKRKPEERGNGCGPTAREAYVTVSIGVADADGAVEPRLLMEDADVALYAAKAAGRNRIEIAPGSTAPKPIASAAPIAVNRFP